MAARCPRPFGHRHEMGSDDLILAKSEDYDSKAPDDSHDELGKREIFAIISPRPAGGDGCTDIVLADGTIWTAKLMPSGSYEFTTVRADGTVVTARWVRRKMALEDDDNYKYTFSVIDPSCRRHPIMGTLTPSTLEVLDNYTTVSPHSAGRHPPTNLVFGANGEGGKTQRTTLPVDEDTRAFMTVSGVWLSSVRLGIAVAPRVHASAGPNAAANGCHGAGGHTRKVSLPVSSLARKNGNGVVNGVGAAQEPALASPATQNGGAGAGSGAGSGVDEVPRRRWTVSGKRRSEVGPAAAAPAPAPAEMEEAGGYASAGGTGGAGRGAAAAAAAGGNAGAEGGKRRLYSRIKRALGIGREEER